MCIRDSCPSVRRKRTVFAVAAVRGVYRDGCLVGAAGGSLSGRGGERAGLSLLQPRPRSAAGQPGGGLFQPDSTVRSVFWMVVAG